MLSGKPPRPWKRSRRRGISVARIALLVVVLSGAGLAAAWYWQPAPMPWHPVGPERIATPAFDLADERTRFASMRVRDVAAIFGRPSVADGCWSFATTPTERYVLTDTGLDRPPRRIEVLLERGGEVRGEQYSRGIDRPPETTHRTFDEAEAERFRDLLVTGGFAAMTPSELLIADCHHSETTILESCVQGRYYAVMRACESERAAATLGDLAQAIDAFAAAPPLPVVAE